MSLKSQLLALGFQGGAVRLDAIVSCLAAEKLYDVSDFVGGFLLSWRALHMNSGQFLFTWHAGLPRFESLTGFGQLSGAEAAFLQKVADNEEAADKLQHRRQQRAASCGAPTAPKCVPESATRGILEVTASKAEDMLDKGSVAPLVGTKRGPLQSVELLREDFALCSPGAPLCTCVLTPPWYKPRNL